MPIRGIVGYSKGAGDFVPIPPPPSEPNVETLLFTETRRNQTASTVNKAPVSFVVAFDPGVVPASNTLVLRDASDNLIPTTHWQWNERSSHPDGSLRSCVIACLSPSMAAGATAQWKVLKTTGSRPAETNARTPAHISSVYDFNVRLTNAAIIRQTGTVYEQRGSGTFRCDVNAGLASNVTVKEFAGPIRTKWYTWRKFIDEGTSAVDAFLWAEFEIDEWIDPDTGNPIHVHLAPPRLRNGWARSGAGTWPAIYQCQIRNGATVLHDYSRSATYQTTDVAAGGITNTHAKLPYGKGSVVRFGAGGPSNVVVGKWYAILSVDSDAILTNLQVRGENAFNLNDAALSFSAATAPFTITTGTFHGSMRICEAANDDGGEHVVLGQPLLYPAWTTTEKRARMDAGMFMPVNLQIATRAPVGTVSDYLIHTLGGALFHRRAFDDTGGGLHIGDSTFWLADVMRSAGMTADRVRRCRITAAEAAQPGPYGYLMSDETNPATGVEYARVVPLNNGSDGAGAAYAGLSSPQPLASTHTNLMPAYFVRAGWSGEGPHPGFMDKGDGTHLTAAHIHDFMMFGTTRYLKLALEIHGKCSTLWPRPEVALGSTQTVGSRTYYCIHVVGVAAVANARANGQISHMLATSCHLADWRPERPYIDDLVDDNFSYMLDSLEAGSKRDAVTKRFGWLTPYVHGGTDQHWFNARSQHGCLALLKRSGWGNSTQRDSIVEWATNFSMIHAQASRSGVQAGFLRKPWQYALGTGDHVLWADDYSGNDVRGTPKGQATEADMGVISAAITFNADSTITLTVPGNVGNNGSHQFPDAALYNAHPQNGDVFVHPNRHVWPSHRAGTDPTSVPPPAAIINKTKYWIYDVAGTGATRTAKISTTPGPAYTQLTWTGSTTGLTFVVWTVLNGNATGPYWNGGAFQYNAENIAMAPVNSAPLACALRWFGKEDCRAPFESYLTGPFQAYTGGYASTGGGAPQLHVNTQHMCDV